MFPRKINVVEQHKRTGANLNFTKKIPVKSHCMINTYESEPKMPVRYRF